MVRWGNGMGRAFARTLQNPARRAPAGPAA